MANEVNLKITAENNQETKAVEEKKFEEWEIEDALRTLLRAEEIKQNEEMMKLIQPKLQKQTKAVNNVAKILFGKTE